MWKHLTSMDCELNMQERSGQYYKKIGVCWPDPVCMRCVRRGAEWVLRVCKWIEEYISPNVKEYKVWIRGLHYVLRKESRQFSLFASLDLGNISVWKYSDWVHWKTWKVPLVWPQRSSIVALCLCSHLTQVSHEKSYYHHPKPPEDLFYFHRYHCAKVI